MEWIKEFDEKFTDVLAFGDDRNFVDISGDIKAFITTQITKARNGAFEEAAVVMETDAIKLFSFEIQREPYRRAAQIIRALKTNI